MKDGYRLSEVSKFIVVIDTNCFFVAKDDNMHYPFIPKKECNLFFKDCIQNNRSFGEYYITESIKQEVIFQKQEQVEKTKKAYQTSCKYLGLEPCKLIDCNIEEILAVYLKANKIEVLPLPHNDRFPHIMQRAFGKLAPFEGKEGKGDKGFKDVLLWESILSIDFSKKGIEILILMTSDKIFDQLQNEFKEKYPNVEFLIKRSWEDLKDTIVALNTCAFAERTIKDELLLEYLKDNNPEITMLIKAKVTIEKIDDNVVKCSALSRLKNNEEIEDFYFYDLLAGEFMDTYEAYEEVDKKENNDETLDKG